MDNVLVTFLGLAFKGLVLMVLYMIGVWYAKGVGAQVRGGEAPESLKSWSGHTVALGSFGAGVLLLMW